MTCIPQDNAALLSGLPALTPQPFVLLDAVTAWDADHLVALRRFKDASAWEGLESMAQAAALHQRRLHDFGRHAFLLSFDECPIPESPLDGEGQITVVLNGHTRDAAAYEATLACGTLCLRAFLSIGLADFGGRFQADTLRTRYRELFQCLTSPLSS